MEASLISASPLKQHTAQVRCPRMLFELFAAVSFGILEGHSRRCTHSPVEHTQNGCLHYKPIADRLANHLLQDSLQRIQQHVSLAVWKGKTLQRWVCNYLSCFPRHSQKEALHFASFLDLL